MADGLAKISFPESPAMLVPDFKLKLFEPVVVWRCAKTLPLRIYVLQKPESRQSRHSRPHDYGLRFRPSGLGFRV